MKKLSLLIVLLSMFSCSEDIKQADSIIFNANIYTVDDAFGKAEAFAIKDGKFLEVGSSEAIKAKYASDNIIDANGKTIVPGLIDAHCHFLGLGYNQQAVDLVGTKSFEDVVKRVSDFQNKNKASFIIGRGWDQNDWEEKEFPKKTLLDKLFPNTPIALTRIDGHAILCNQAALDLGKVTADSKIEG